MPPSCARPATATRRSSKRPQRCAIAGRIVVVGITKVELPWRTFSEKEIEVRYSRSYGPGRYDPTYEWGGSDYPIGYVRWTEQRNFDAVLHLMAQGQLRLEHPHHAPSPLAEALSVYQTLTTDSKDIGIVLEYPGGGGRIGARSRKLHPRRSAQCVRPRPCVTSGPTAAPPLRLTSGDGRALVWRPASGGAKDGSRGGRSRLDVIGAGNFARTMLLPHLKDKLAFGTIVNQTALSARHVQAKFGFEKAATDASGVAQERERVRRRADCHSPSFACAAGHDGLGASPAYLRGKAALLEPGRIARDRCAPTSEARAPSKSGSIAALPRPAWSSRRRWRPVPGPKSASFRVNAGKLDPQHWYANFNESGGRVLGEACHFLDYFCFIFDSDPVRVFAQTTWPATRPAGLSR